MSFSRNLLASLQSVLRRLSSLASFSSLAILNRISLSVSLILALRNAVLIVVKIGYEREIHIQNQSFQFIIYFCWMPLLSIIVDPMLPRLKELKKPERINQRGTPPKSQLVTCTECKQVIVLPNGACYCGIWKETISTAFCKYCPYYGEETLEYRLFKRR